MSTTTAAMTRDIETSQGLARAHLRVSGKARGALVLGHGAGGGVAAPDLQAAAAAALEHDLTVALVEQPYRVAGRRSPAPAARLDAAWIDVLGQLGAHDLANLPVVVGGRSAGARVACRTATRVGAAGVLCLAFPLLPPRRARSTKAPASRAGELDAVTVPVLVIQGHNDRFGIPPEAPRRTVVEVNGDHSLRGDLAALRVATGDWLDRLLGGTL
jgi:uncharacterized protein